MRILHLAFIESSFRQLLVKTDQQHRVMKRLNPETSCFVIGVRREGTITDDLSPRYIELAGHRDALELRLAHFAEAEKLVQSIQPDVI